MSKTVSELTEQIDLMEATLSKINKIADNAARGVHPADWRKDWQRAEWNKVKQLSEEK
jgi:hypothetical protein